MMALVTLGFQEIVHVVSHLSAVPRDLLVITVVVQIGHNV